MKRIISFLGTGNYDITAYQSCVDQKRYETAYVVEALFEFYHPDEVCVLATKEAKVKHGKELESIFSNKNCQFKLVDIPTGNHKDELWRQFEVFRKQMDVEQDTEILIDITHGFRAQPFFAAASIAMSLVKPNKKDQIIEVVYGELRRDEAMSPIWDISLFIELLQWTFSIGLFLRTGYLGELVDLLDQKNRLIKKEIARSGQRQFPQTGQLTDALKKFGDDIATVRIASIITGYEQSKKSKAISSADALIQAIENIRPEIENYFKPLAEILDDMLDNFKGLPSPELFSEQGHQSMLQLANLYLDYERYPEASIVIREAFVNLFAQESDAIEVNKTLDKQKRSEAEVRWFKHNENEAKNIGNTRNDIQHGGFNTQPKSGQDLIKHVKNMQDKLQAFQSPSVLETVKQSRNLFVSRHSGALEWAQKTGVEINEMIPHLNINDVQPGDKVYGSLPVSLAFSVCQKGAHYFHLNLDLPQQARGIELTSEDMVKYGAFFQEFKIEKVKS